MQKHSSKIAAQILALYFKTQNIEHIVISPGSRNAPLIIEFTADDFFKNYSIIDERSAGFFALGMAQQLQKPVVLVCSSGSALLNYYPAVAEAFYSKIPLIILSADRPKKWVDQGEGQTIRQHNVFENHSLYNVSLLEDFEEDSLNINRNLIKNAIKTTVKKQGPVHINVPFDEPLYNFSENLLQIDASVNSNVADKIYAEEELIHFEKIWNQSDKKMIIVGQNYTSEFLQLQMEKFSKDPSVIVLNENISNISHKLFINNIDQAIFSLKNNELQDLQPDIIISVGRNLISKKIKQFLRKFKAKHHWHIEKTDLPPNTFECLTKHFKTSPEMFFSQFLFLAKTFQSDYQNKWLQIKNKNKEKHKQFLKNITFSDLKIFEILAKNIPENYMIQWGNSSTVRYAQLFDFNKKITHFSNRGTSGIDGSSSTAIGACFASKKNTLLVTGDISFLYDSNALWNKYIPDNFKIILINNGGGDIFNFIPGPSKTEALEEFFVTKHSYNAKKLAEMYHFKYQLASNLTEFENKLSSFFNEEKQAQILEVDTSKIDNAKFLKDYFNNFL